MRLILTLAAIAALSPSVAFAQPHQNDHKAAHQAPAHRPTAHPAPAPQHGRATPHRMSHAERCRARFRSYNPRTDRYVVRPGVTRRCTL